MNGKKEREEREKMIQQNLEEVNRKMRQKREEVEKIIENLQWALNGCK